MTSPDKPFVLRSGANTQTAIFNRIAVYERIKFLTGVDLRKKDIIYRKTLDLELYKQDSTIKPPDEDWCQRAAQVILAMEGKETKLNQEEYDKAWEEFNARKNTRVRRENAGAADQERQSSVRPNNPPGNNSRSENTTQ